MRSHVFHGPSAVRSCVESALSRQVAFHAECLERRTHRETSAREVIHLYFPLFILIGILFANYRFVSSRSAVQRDALERLMYYWCFIFFFLDICISLLGHLRRGRWRFDVVPEEWLRARRENENYADSTHSFKYYKRSQASVKWLRIPSKDKLVGCSSTAQVAMLLSRHIFMLKRAMGKLYGNACTEWDAWGQLQARQCHQNELCFVTRLLVFNEESNDRILSLQDDEIVA